MATIAVERGKPTFIPSKLKFIHGLKVYVEADSLLNALREKRLPEEVVVEPEEDLNGVNPRVILHLKPKNDCTKNRKSRKATEKQSLP